MRILHLTLSAAQGGRRDAILTLIDYLRPLGAECGLVALRNLPSEVAEVGSHVDYHDGMEIAGRPTVPELVNVAKLCRDRRVDLLHAHDAGSQFVASVLRVFSPSLRVVMTFHRTLGLESEGFRNRVRNAVSLPMVQRIVTASDERRRYFQSKTMVRADKVVVIPFGVDLGVYHPDPAIGAAVRREMGIAPDTVLALAIGHFGYEKGVDQLIEAMAYAKERLGDRPWHLLVVGAGPPNQVAAIEEASARLLGNHVTLLGFRNDVSRLLQAADLLVHAPRAEAFGLAVIQAMASGLPIVSMAAGGLPETILDGRTGHLIKPGDVDMFGAAVVQLIENPGTRLRLGQGGLRRAREHFDARVTAEQHLALYESLLQNHSPGTRNIP